MHVPSRTSSTYFERTDLKLILEADETDLDGYIADLKRRGPKKRGRGGMIEDASPDETRIRHLSGRKLSDNTIAQRVVACRLFYDFLLRKNLRSDPFNPIERGSDGRDGGRPRRGPVGSKRRLPGFLPMMFGRDLSPTSYSTRTAAQKQ